MSIENTLERIAVALEEFVQEQRLHNHAWKQYAETLRGMNFNLPIAQPAPQSTPAPTYAPSSGASVSAPPAIGGPPVSGSPTQAGAPPVPAGAVPGPSASVPPTVAPGAGVPFQSSPVAAGVPGPTAPVTSAPVPTQMPQTPVQGVPTLDDIKALANDFHRAYPERAAEFVQVLASKNAQKLSELPPDSYLEVHKFLKQKMGQG